MLKEEIERNKILVITHGVSIFALASTFFGFLVVNVYLSIFGFWDFNFLKVQYFSAGTLFLLLVIVPGILFFAFLKAKEILAKYAEKQGKIKKYLVFLLNIVIFFLVSTLSVFLFVFPLAFSNAEYSEGFLNFLSVFWTAMILIMVILLTSSHKDIVNTQYKETNLKNITTYFGAHYQLTFVIFIFISLTFIFSFFIYPAVPRYFGGGKPVAISIGFENSFNPQQINGTNPLNVFLIYQSSDSLLILSDSGSYLLKQSDVTYIKYLETNAHLNTIRNITSGK